MAESAPAAGAIRICAAEQLLEGEAGVRWPATFLRNPVTIFVIRYAGQVHGYLNMCAHVPMELDWSEGQFFDSSGLYLMCATHGAIYAPDSGQCVGGPCRGASLRQVRVEERDTPSGRAVFWWPDQDVSARLDEGSITAATSDKNTPLTPKESKPWPTT